MSNEPVPHEGPRGKPNYNSATMPRSGPHDGYYENHESHNQYNHRQQYGGYHGNRGRRGGDRGSYGRGRNDYSQQHGYYNNYHSHSHIAPPAAYHREEKPDEELFKDHTPGINFDQYEAVEVSLTPDDVVPAEDFRSMQLAPALKENIVRCCYTKPTPVQKYGIPVVVMGKDLMACAQTGSGKTAAYLIPAINYILTNNCSRRGDDNNRTRFPSALILAPTRELGIQINEEGRKFTYRSGIRSVVVYGGADPGYQIMQLQSGCGLLVATPGRLLDLYNRGYIGFEKIRFLVLDEADRMLDMGFEPQIRKIVCESDMPPPGHRQTLMYSATFPKEIRQLAWEFLKDHSFLQIGRVGSTTASIHQDVRWVEDRDKTKVLLSILEDYKDALTLVFVEKKFDADNLDRYLSSVGYSVASIHGDRGQREREQALALFKNGRCNILVATDVASRGLDIPNVKAVVQYDLPTNIDDYVHRIGRTGRAGKEGTAISFFNGKNHNVADDLVTLLEETKQLIPPQVQVLAKQRKPNQVQGRGGRGGYGGRGNRGRGYGLQTRGRGGHGGIDGYQRHFDFRQDGASIPPQRTEGFRPRETYGTMNNRNYRFSTPHYGDRPN